MFCSTHGVDCCDCAGRVTYVYPKCTTCDGWGDTRGAFRYCPECAGSGIASSEGVSS